MNSGSKKIPLRLFCPLKVAHVTLRHRQAMAESKVSVGLLALVKQAPLRHTGIPRASLFRLTEGLTAFMTAMRDKAIALEKDEGKSQNEIVKTLGVSKGTVNSVVNAAGQKISVRQNDRDEVAKSLSETNRHPEKKPKSLFDNIQAPTDIRTFCRGDSPDVSPFEGEELEVNLEKDATYEKKKAALDKQVSAGWDTIARNLAKKEKRPAKT